MRTPAGAALLAALVLVGSPPAALAGAEEGKALYEKQCKVCHSLAGEAGKMAEKGGPLDGVGAKRDAAWLRQYIANPKSVMPDAKMPKLKMTEKELEDHVAYMSSLR